MRSTAWLRGFGEWLAQQPVVVDDERREAMEMAEITCKHTDLRFKYHPQFDTVRIECVACRRYVVMQPDQNNGVNTVEARHRIDAVWQTRERLSH